MAGKATSFILYIHINLAEKQKERSRSHAQKTLASNFLPGKFHSLEEPSV
jgi:hypothetical protein